MLSLQIFTFPQAVQLQYDKDRQLSQFCNLAPANSGPPNGRHDVISQHSPTHMQHSGRAVSQRATRYSSRDAHDYIRPITSSSIWNTFSVSTPVWFPEHTNGNEITEPQKNIQIFSLTQTILNHKIHKMTEGQCHCHCIQQPAG